MNFHLDLNTILQTLSGLTIFAAIKMLWTLSIAQATQAKELAAHVKTDDQFHTEVRADIREIRQAADAH